LSPLTKSKKGLAICSSDVERGRRYAIHKKRAAHHFPENSRPGRRRQIPLGGGKEGKTSPELGKKELNPLKKAGKGKGSSGCRTRWGEIRCGKGIARCFGKKKKEKRPVLASRQKLEKDFLGRRMPRPQEAQVERKRKKK